MGGQHKIKMIRLVLVLGMSLVHAQNPFRPKRWSLAAIPQTPDAVFKRDGAAGPADGADQSEYIEVSIHIIDNSFIYILDVRKNFSNVRNPCLSSILHEKLPVLPRPMRCPR